MSRVKTACATALASACLLALATVPASAATGIPNREADPVVLTARETPRLIGVDPDDVIAFAWDDGWIQVPVQVDERKRAEYRTIRNNSMSSGSNFFSEVYADPNTFTRADGVPQRPAQDPVNGAPIPLTTGDPNLDVDDEIAMLANDAGDSAEGEASPAGVETAGRTEVTVKDPLDGTVERFIYLFEQADGFAPAPLPDQVSYGLNYTPPLVGGYFSGYNFGGVAGGDNASSPGDPLANPESSIVATDLYAQTFPGRWMVDGLRINAGDATGVDILDGDKATIGQSGCGRNEKTFSRGGGGVIAAIDGPVRAIRSYIGANSGTFTQRDQIYYPGRFDNNTYLRVHQGITDFIMAMDYSEAAFGMTYRNSLNETPVTIDGAGGAEGMNGLSGKVNWELVTGDQGSLTNVMRIDSNVPNMTYGTYYQDDMAPPAGNNAILCSGDTHAIGASGPRIRMAGAGFNTDPTLPPTAPSTAVNKFTGHRVTFYGAPGATVATAQLRSQQVDAPLDVDTGEVVPNPTGPSGPTGPDEPPPVGPTGPTGPVPGNPKPPTKPVRKNWVGLKVSVKPASLDSQIGTAKKLTVTVRNIGDKLGRRIRICPVANDSLVKVSDCHRVRKLKPHRRVKRSFRVRLRSAAAGEERVVVRFRAKASRSKARSAKLTIRPS